ncbi:MAG: HAMP domain-containing protein [Alphaproteobacteria bacterium]|jgi:signal transduction histidine kinase|nr:HAMP domain-containing protein [Alphaproteobacteria bacterium]
MRFRLPAFARTTTFRLSLLYAVLITVYSAALLGYLYVSTVGFMANQTDERINAEIDSIERAYRDGGLARVSQSLIERASAPDRYFLYQLETPSGIKLSGDLSDMPSEQNGKVGFEIDARRPDGTQMTVNAEGRIIELGNEARLLVAFDAGERGTITRRITLAVYTAAAVGLLLSLLGGVLISRSVARRAEELVHTAEAVMAGDLTQRAPVRIWDDEFDRLAERMNSMLDRLEHLVRDSRHTGDAIAHDLRSPLSRMRNRLEAALARPLAAQDAEAALRLTIEEVDQVLATFNAILRLSRLDAGTEGRLVRMDASEVLVDVAEFLEPVAEAAELDFSIDASRNMHVMGDRDLIMQAMSNLIENAIKYTPAGGRISVSARRAAEGYVDLIVADTGPGIPDAERDDVKKRFVRGDSARTLQGSGLGLALVEAVAAVHRGSFEMSDAGGPPEAPGLKAVLRLRRA